ncbi:hypothetical protein ABZU76_25130 [Amycolatopsis sp. NPDC005232]|uniref:hypothetical protein n=1 Tax=Amycolatopsis sp. NPDC005232 TaxID=3157027 RepID=UPI0033B89B29
MTAEVTEFLTAGLRPHECRSCGTCVLVKKNSLAHTSIQWTTDASHSCPVFATHVAAGRHPALLDTCEKLADSITDAVRDGSLAVADRSCDGSAAEVVRGG